jgi:hypothetical protein
MSINNNSKLAIVIPSCDKYSDLWNILISQIKINFKDIKITKYIVCNSSPKKSPIDLEYINVGVDLGWSTNLINALEHVKEQYIFLWIDDLILTSFVDTKLFENILNTFIFENGNYLRLNNVPKSNKNYNNYYGLIDSKALYRTSTVMSIWNKDVLKDLLVHGENAWEFEIKGSMRSIKYDKFFVSYESIFNFSNAVIKGKWNQKIKYKLIHEHGYYISDTRPSMTQMEQLNYDLKLIATAIYYRLYNFYLKINYTKLF